MLREPNTTRNGVSAALTKNGDSAAAITLAVVLDAEHFIIRISGFPIVVRRRPLKFCTRVRRRHLRVRDRTLTFHVAPVFHAAGNSRHRRYHVEREMPHISQGFSFSRLARFLRGMAALPILAALRARLLLCRPLIMWRPAVGDTTMRATCRRRPRAFAPQWSCRGPRCEDALSWEGWLRAGRTLTRLDCGGGCAIPLIRRPHWSEVRQAGLLSSILAPPLRVCSPRLRANSSQIGMAVANAAVRIVYISVHPSSQNSLTVRLFQDNYETYGAYSRGRAPEAARCAFCSLPMPDLPPAGMFAKWPPSAFWGWLTRV